MGYRTDFAEKDFEKNLALGLISKDLRPFERVTSHLDCNGGKIELARNFQACLSYFMSVFVQENSSLGLRC